MPSSLMSSPVDAPPEDAPADGGGLGDLANNFAGAVADGGDDINWNPIEWDRAAEELTWERLLGLDGSLVFLEHVFWVVSLNTMFILVFGECNNQGCGVRVGGVACFQLESGVRVAFLKLMESESGFWNCWSRSRNPKKSSDSTTLVIIAIILFIKIGDSSEFR